MNVMRRKEEEREGEKKRKEGGRKKEEEKKEMKELQKRNIYIYIFRLYVRRLGCRFCLLAADN